MFKLPPAFPGPIEGTVRIKGYVDKKTASLVRALHAVAATWQDKRLF